MSPAFNLKEQSYLFVRQVMYLTLTSSSLKIAVAAMACAWFVQTEQLNYTHLLDVLVGSIVNEPISVNEFFTT